MQSDAMNFSPSKFVAFEQQYPNQQATVKSWNCFPANISQPTWRAARLMVVACAMLLLARPLLAQNPGGFPNLPNPAPRQPQQLPAGVQERLNQGAAKPSETELETIAKCLRDLQSPNVADRRKAAMLIGKYRTPEAVQAVIKCLDDADAMVRQSALVSLTEDRMLPAEARMPVFQLLLDPDVHIRRLASALIPEASGVSIAGPVAITGNISIRASGGRSEEENKAILIYLNKALEDEDPSVRRNVLSGARFFPEPLDPEKIAVFFTDPTAEVRSLALIAYAQVYGLEKERAERLRPLLQDPVPAVRQELARTAARLGGAGTPLLKTLIKDQDLTVRVEAVRQFSGQLDPDAFPPLRDMILNQQLPIDLRQSMLRLLRAYPTQASEVYETLLADSSPEIQAEAIRIIGNDESNKRDIAFFLPFLQSPSSSVQQAASIVILRRRQELTPENLQTLLTGKTTEAKLLALRLCSAIPEEQRQELLLDACLDADVAIRKQALQQIAVFRPDGWQEILLASLNDSNQEIQDAAAMGLARIPKPTPEIVTALQEYLPNCRHDLTRRLVTNFLQRAAAQEAARQQRPAPRTINRQPLPARPRTQPIRPAQPTPVVPNE